MAADSSSNGTEAWRLKKRSSLGDAGGVSLPKKDRQKRRVELPRISGSLKNGVFSTLGGPDELQTAFFGHLEFQIDQKRRFEFIGRGGTTGNGVSGAPQNCAGVKTTFFGRWEFQTTSKRRF
jgi:hypothetical protein